MKTFATLFLIFSFIFCSSAVAQTDPVGLWQGKLVIDQNNKMTVDFLISKQPDGSYKAVLNSPDMGAIKNVTASAVNYTGGKLTIDVAGLNGSFTGTVGKGVITGEWKQQGSTFPLVLTPWKKPEFGAREKKLLLGEWGGRLKIGPDFSMGVGLRFENTRDGKFVSFLDSYDEGAMGIPVTDVLLVNDEVSFRVPIANALYTGKLSNNSITGTYNVGGMTSYELNVTRGKYQPPAIDMPAEEMNKLLGKWVGKMDVTGDMVYTIFLEFEKTKEGKLKAFTHSPEQGEEVISLANLSFKDNQLSFKMPARGGEYSGKLDNNSISGTYTVRGKNYVLNVTKGAKYEALVPQVDIPAGAIKPLLGRWKGNLGAQPVAFRFEQKADGKITVSVEITNLGRTVKVYKTTLNNDNLMMKASGMEYNGKLSGNKIDGTIKIIDQGVTLPMPLTKE